MGNRTVVILYNDNYHVWSKDPELGEKIGQRMNYVGMRNGDDHRSDDLGYGRVVEMTHADTQTLAVLDSYSFKPIAHSSWYARDGDSVEVKLLKVAAANLGYKLIKQSKKETDEG